jgi:parvulin-like peptidyl-prolyl isomerase
MPPDFFAAVINMHVGKISKPVRTRFGFHILQLTDHEPPRRMLFDEAREGIGFTLENEKRQAVLQNLGVELLGRAELCACDPGSAFVSVGPRRQLGNS